MTRLEIQQDSSNFSTKNSFGTETPSGKLQNIGFYLIFAKDRTNIFRDHVL